MWLEEGMEERDASTEGQEKPRPSCAENEDEVSSGQRATAASATDETCCPICFEPIIAGEAQLITTCRHAFHFPCIRKWLPKGLCPVCRNSGWLGEDDVMDEDELAADLRDLRYSYEEELSDFLDFLPPPVQGAFHFLSPLPPDVMMAAIPSNEFRVWQRGPGFPVPQPPPPPPRPRNEQRPHRGATAIVPPFQQPTIPGTDPGPPWMRPRGQRDASARNQWGMYGGRPSQGEDEVRPPPVDLQATLLNNPPNVMTNVMDVQYHVPGHDARADARRLAEARRIMDSHQEERPPWPPAPHATDVDTDAGFAPFNPVVAEPPWPRNFHMPCPHRGAQDSWPSAAGPHSGGQWVGPMWGPDPGPCSSWSPMPYHPASPGPPRDAAQAEQYSGYRSFHAPPHPPRGPPSHDRHDGTRMGRMQQHEL